jgi:hypothetical protein
MATFNDLPPEIRNQIYDLALYTLKPRVVTVHVHEGRIFPTTAPPALLHVNCDSRSYALYRYKPWLPEFDGSAGHERYKDVATAHADHIASFSNPNAKGAQKSLSSLENIIVDLEKDILLIEPPQDDISTKWSTKWYPKRVFGM